MKHKLKLILFGLLIFIFGAAMAVYIQIKAGSLTPSASPAASSYTLSDIYARLTTNATSTAGSHSFTPGASPAGTFYSLTQIYNAIPTIDPTKVLTGTSYLGVSGTFMSANWPTIPDSGWTQCAAFTDTSGDDISNGWTYGCNGYKYLKFSCTLNGVYGGTAGTTYSYIVENFPYKSNIFSDNNAVILPKSGGILNNQASYDYNYNSGVNPTYSFGWEGFKYNSYLANSVDTLAISGCWGCSGTPGYGLVFAVSPGSLTDEGWMCNLISQASGSTGDSYRIYGKN